MRIEKYQKIFSKLFVASLFTYLLWIGFTRCTEWGEYVFGKVGDLIPEEVIGAILGGVLFLLVRPIGKELHDEDQESIDQVSKSITVSSMVLGGVLFALGAFSP